MKLVMGYFAKACILTLVALPLHIWAQTQKCVGADGKVTYTDKSCTASEKSVELNPQHSLRGTSIADELVCAGTWGGEEDEYVQALGIVPAGDRVILNGRDLEIYKGIQRRPAVTAMNFPICQKYGFTRPSNLKDVSRNTWAALNIQCKMLDPQYQKSAMVDERTNEKLRDLLKSGFGRQNDLAKVCQVFRKEFATPTEIEMFYRKKYRETSASRPVDIVPKSR